MKKALMIVAIIVLVAIAGSVVYYFVFFKPGIEKDQLELQKQKVKNISTTTSSVVTIKTETEADKFNKEITDLFNFFKAYSDKTQTFEDKWTNVRSSNPTKKYTFEEITVLTNDELNAIKGILVFPESVTKYIDYDLLYIKTRGKIFSTFAFITEKVKNIDISRDYPDLDQDTKNMNSYLDQRDNEIRNILINYNTRAKELGLSVPFPNN